MLTFRPLTVRDIRRETNDSVSIAFSVPPALRDEFKFSAGQYLTLRTRVSNEEVRRSYSLCVSPQAFERNDELRVAVKLVRDGRFSSFANAQLKVGDELDVLPPDGRFTSAFSPGRSQHYLGFAGGSGITPLLSLIETALTVEPASRFTLVYGNRSLGNIMFAEGLEDLKDRFVSRFTLYHVISDEPQEVELFNGLLDQAKCAQLLDTLIPVSAIDEVFICGPEPMMDAAEAALKAAGMAADKIRIERFGVPMPASAPRVHVGSDHAHELHIIADGKRRQVQLDQGQAVLDAGLAAGLPLPYACKSGVCCTCKAKVLEGKVRMARNFTLTEGEQAQGFVLTCQGICESAKVVISYDERA